MKNWLALFILWSTCFFEKAELKHDWNLLSQQVLNSENIQKRSLNEIIDCGLFGNLKRFKPN